MMRLIPESARQGFALVLKASLLIMCTACDRDPAPQTNVVTEDTVKKIALEKSPQRYTRGLRLYQQHCSGCHGKQAQGAANWQRKNAQGKYPPPPLNGTGHTWHHSREVLVSIINKGTLAEGGDMPAWQGRLTAQQIDDILFWIQSQWDREIYQAWVDTYQAGK